MNYFTRTEKLLWISSVILILGSFFIFDGESYLTVLGSLLGVTSLIFNAKGNPIGQGLIIIFSTFYGYISYEQAYYGEMLTYVGMTLPMAIFALVSWIKNPYEGDRSEVAVDRLTARDFKVMWGLAVLVTVIFYFILKYFETDHLIVSTISVLTSFLAVYLTYRRNPYFAVAYAANDIVLIVLWTLAAFEDVTYVSMVACFAAFFANDIYSFWNWKQMEHRQAGKAVSVSPEK